MFRYDIAVDAPILDAYDALAQTAPRTLRAFLGGTMTNHLERQVQTRLAIEPRPVVYPIEWTSERQRRAFFATDGFGHGIPYKRTGGLKESWTVEFDTANLIIAIGNKSPAAQFVVGERQQQFHKTTGWLDAQPVILDIVIEAIDLLADGWFSIMELKPLL